MLTSGASFASELSDYALAPTQPTAPMTRTAENMATSTARNWTVDIVDPAKQAGHHMPAANRDTDPAAVDRELAANPGLESKLMEMKVNIASIQAIAVKDLGTGSRTATVFVR